MLSLLTRVCFMFLFSSSALVSCQDVCEFLKEFQEFKMKYNKTYDNPVFESKAYEAFEDNLRFINGIIALEKDGKVTFTLGINEFTDMTTYDFAKLRNGFKITDESDDNVQMFQSSLTAPPESVDWRTSGAVTRVKNQLKCGACWAFTATGAIEGQHFLKTGDLVPLSEQNLIDCSATFGTQGCKSGDMKKAFNYIVANKGIDTEASYPYEAREGQCRFTNKSIGATITGYKLIKKKDEVALKKVVYVIGPIAAAIDANHKSFQQYKSGIYFEKDCSEDNVDHGVLIVGYGVENGVDYWIVKNSYGPNWGENGYIRMARNRGNNCGIASHPIFPTI